MDFHHTSGCSGKPAISVPLGGTRQSAVNWRTANDEDGQYVLAIALPEN